MASKSFIRGLLDDPEDPQLPQYNPQGGWDAAANFGRMAAGMTTPGAVADAAGLLGSPSLRENVSGGNYLDAAMQGVGVLPVVGGVAKGLLGAGALYKAAKMGAPEIKTALNPSIVRMFLGPNAKTADKAALAEAEKMHSAGAPRENIIDKTGWFKGVDDKWRFEVPDNEASLKGYIQPGAAFEGDLSEAITHPDVYNAYPNMRDINLNYGQNGVSSGAYAPPIDGIHGVDEHIRIGRKSDNPLSTGLHEMQHAIQDREGFAAGGNNLTLKPGTPAWDIYQERLQAIKTPLNRETYSLAAGYDGLAPEKDYKAYLKIVKNPEPYIIKEAQKYAADTAYLRQAGEVEARTTQKRMGLTADERKARYPWLDYDIPENQQIVRFRGNPESGLLGSK
ncbi:MAG: hypothetical protein EB015_17560 [Methylocystaceae bacterium]|nr:hypothetical protein [Methylocystaceae bacterium]